MTSRTHDNFRHNFWTWVDPPPPFEQCSKKLHFSLAMASLSVYKCFQRPWSGGVFHINYEWLSSYIFYLTKGNTHWEMYLMYLIFSKTLTPLSGKCSLIRTKSQIILTPYKNIVSAGVMSYCKSRRTSHHDPDNSPQQKDLLTSVHNILLYINSTAAFNVVMVERCCWFSSHFSSYSNRILWIWKQSCDISK